MTCTVCGKTAHMYVGKVGWCAEHRADAIAAAKAKPRPITRDFDAEMHDRVINARQAGYR